VISEVHIDLRGKRCSFSRTCLQLIPLIEFLVLRTASEPYLVTASMYRVDTTAFAVMLAGLPDEIHSPLEVRRKSMRRELR
jgi:hypothetical protein